MKILFLATNPASTEASTRYRVAQYFSTLRAAGHSLSLSTFFLDGAMASHRARIPQGLVRRCLDIARAGSFDVVLVHRELLPHAWNHAASLVATRAPMVFDFDDMIFMQTRKGWRGALSLPASTSRLVTSARVVFAGNDYLADYARAFSDRVEVLPTVVDTEVYHPVVREERDEPVIGWIGSPTTFRYLEPVLPILDAMAKDFRFRVRVVGAGRSVRLDNVVVETPEWHAENEAAFFQDLDIGVYPLVDEPWALGKCGFKAIQYMACGVASVVSPIGVVRKIVRDGTDAIWAETPAQWRNALANLLQDGDMRARLGEAGRKRIETSYSLRAMSPRFVAGLERAAGVISPAPGGGGPPVAS